MEIVRKVKYNPKTNMPKVYYYGYIYRSADNEMIPIILPNRPK